MNNFKKIGLTALAGSLVATSVFAGELTATGAASIGVSNITGNADQSMGNNWSMGNSVTLAGSSELDNGLTITVSMELDADAANDGGPFDDQSITIASDTLGTLKFSGHGGSSAQSAMDATAAGDIWNQTLGITTVAASGAGEDSFFYTLPELMDGLALTASYHPGEAVGPVHSAFGIAYTGVEGLTLNFAQGTSGVPSLEIESTVMKASYAIGSFTLGVSSFEATKKGAANEEVQSYQIAYTVSDDMSVTYGSETHDLVGNATDEEVTALGVSYTTGGMTLSANQYEAKGAGNTAGAVSDKWALGLSFAF